VVERYPDIAFWRPPAGELGPGAPPPPVRAAASREPDPRGGHGAYVDSTADEI
jgi:hypothetical protein